LPVGGRGWLFAPAGLADGSLPTHYEPAESVAENPLYGRQSNPARLDWKRCDNPLHRPFGDPRYRYVLTTYRLTEHDTAGGMNRWLSWLAELPRAGVGHRPSGHPEGRTRPPPAGAGRGAAPV
jgi:formate dehydrogenase major subunit